MLDTKKALLIVDVQADFCPGGALPVPDGDKVINVLNKYSSIFERHRWPVFASRDWHPTQTKHFQKYGGPWPVHCVQKTPGAAFHPRLRLSAKTMVISKGNQKDEDGYSAFEGRDGQGHPLADILKALRVEEIYIGGLATDYCVKASALDAVRNGFQTFVLTDAIRAVELHPGDGANALKEMRAAGVEEIDLSHFDSAE